MSPPTPSEGGRTGRRRRSARRSRGASRTPLPRRLVYAVQDRAFALTGRTRQLADAWHGGAGARRRLARRAGTSARSATRTSAIAVGRFGDRASGAILAAVSLAGRALSRAVARTGEVVTPLRTVAVVTGFAAIALGVAQFVDYRAVEVGVAGYEGYADVEAVAPPPQVDREPAGSAHAYVLLPVALAALAALFLCVRGRWHLGRTISLLGIVAIAVTLIVDLPAALDVGEQAALYESTEPTLLEGFWAQLSAAITLLVGGILISRYSAPLRRGARARAPRHTGAAAGLRGAA